MARSGSPPTPVGEPAGDDAPVGRADPDQFLGYRIVRLAAALERQFKRDLAATGLTPRQFSVLAVLAQRPSITVADLARAVLTTPQSMAALVDGLERRGLLLRSAARQRGVAAPLAPTPAGLAALAHAAPRIATSERAVFGHLTERQRDALNRVLTELEDHTLDSGDNRTPSDRA